MNLRHIVVATDESDAGRQAVRTGLKLAARASARLTVMRVVSIQAVPVLAVARTSVLCSAITWPESRSGVWGPEPALAATFSRDGEGKSSIRSWRPGMRWARRSSRSGITVAARPAFSRPGAPPDAWHIPRLARYSLFRSKRVGMGVSQEGNIGETSEARDRGLLRCSPCRSLWGRVALAIPRQLRLVPASPAGRWGEGRAAPRRS
jgi:hypothetical protein